MRSTTIFTEKCEEPLGGLVIWPLGYFSFVWWIWFGYAFCYCFAQIFVKLVLKWESFKLIFFSCYYITYIQISITRKRTMPNRDVIAPQRVNGRNTNYLAQRIFIFCRNNSFEAPSYGNYSKELHTKNKF